MVQELNSGSNPDGAERLRQRAEARRSEILHAAARVFRRLGYAATGMREIAAEAGLSPGNLYHYFSAKHEILFFCQDRSLEHLLGALERAQEGGSTPGRQLRRVIEAHVCCLLDELEGSAAHLEVEALPPDLREQIIAKRDLYERGMRELVIRGAREGAFVAGDAGLVTRAMLGAVNWTARWYRREGPSSPEEVARLLADYLVRGLENGRTDENRENEQNSRRRVTEPGVTP